MRLHRLRRWKLSLSRRFAPASLWLWHERESGQPSCHRFWCTTDGYTIGSFQKWEVPQNGWCIMDVCFKWMLFHTLWWYIITQNGWFIMEHTIKMDDSD